MPAKLKNITRGTVVNKTFAPDANLESADVSKRLMNYCFKDGTSYVFQGTDTYEQVRVDSATLEGPKTS